MIEDSLGRTVDAGGMSISDLKGMLSSLMSGKTTAQPIPESAKTPDKSAAAKQTYDILKQINANLGQQFNQQKNYLEQVIALLKSSGSNGNSTKSMSSSIEKFSLSLSENSVKTQTLSNGLENTTQSIKNYSQSISKLDKTMSSMLGLMRTAMNYAMKQMGGGGLGKDASKELAEINKTEKSAAALEKVHGGKLHELATHGLKKGSIYTHDYRLAQINIELKKALIDFNSGVLNRTQYDSKVAGLEKDKLDVELLKLKDAAKKLNPINILPLIQKIAGVTAKATAAPSIKDTVMGGHAGGPAEAGLAMMNEQRELTIESRKIAYETAGITGKTRALQEEYLMTEESTLRTGVKRVELQKRLLQFQRMGVKDQSLLKDVTVATVAAEKQLGLEAGALGDDFLKLHQEAGFTKGQINQTAKGMMDVARSSGLSGNELKRVMDSSKNILQNMKNAATLTADAIKNVNTVMAEAQKLGVTEQLSTLLTAAASSSNIFLKASSETKTLLFQAAGSVSRIADLQNGVLLKSKSGMKDLGIGMDNILKRFGVNGVDAIENMSDEAKARLNIQLQSVYKMDLGEFMRSAKALKEGARGYSERLAEIDKQLEKNGTTQLDIEARKQAQIKKSSLLQEASGDLLNVFEESLKGAGTGAAGMDKALEKFSASLTKGDAKSKDLQESIAALAAQKNIQGPLTGQQSLGLAMEANLLGLNKKLESVGLAGKALDPKMIAEAMGDKDKFQALKETMQKLEQEAAAKEKAMADPALQAEYELLKINDTIAKIAQDTGNNIAETLGYEGLIAAATTEYVVQTILGNDLLRKILDAIMAIPQLIAAVMSPVKWAAGLFKGTGIATALANPINALTKRIPIIGGVVDFARRLKDGEGLGKATAGGLGTFAGGIAGAKLGAMAGTFLTPILGPLGPALGGIVGSVIGMITGSKFGALAYDYIIKPIIDAIIGFGRSVGTFLYDYIWKPFINFFSWLGSKAGTIFTDYIWKPFVNFFSWLGGTAIGGLFVDYIWTPFANFFGWMGSSIGGLFMDYLWTPFAEFWSWVGSGIGTFFTDWVYNPIANKFTELGTKLGEIGTWLMDTLMWPFKKVYDWLGNWGPSLWNWIKSVVAKIPIVGSYLVGSGDAGTTAPAATAPSAPPPMPQSATGVPGASSSLEKAQQAAAMAAQRNAATQAQLQQRSMLLEAQKQIQELHKTDPNKAAEMEKMLKADMERLNISRPGATGPTAAPTGPGGPSVSAVPSMSGPMVPSYQTMAATKTGTSSITMSPTVGGIGELAKVGQSELEYAKQQVELLGKILASLSSGSGGSSGSTASSKSPSSGTDNYFKLPTGNFNESSIREVTNL